jgi:hypothetical protein
MDDSLSLRIKTGRDRETERQREHDDYMQRITPAFGGRRKSDGYVESYKSAVRLYRSISDPADGRPCDLDMD